LKSRINGGFSQSILACKSIYVEYHRIDQSLRLKSTILALK
jgi:hypothetical protein